MTDTTHKAPKRVYKFFEYGAEEHVRYDTAQAIVAAALTEAAGVTELVQSTSDKAWKSGDREHSEDFYRGAASAAEVIGRRILALITPDAQAALDQMLAAEAKKSPDR